MGVCDFSHTVALILARCLHFWRLWGGAADDSTLPDDDCSGLTQAEEAGGAGCPAVRWSENFRFFLEESGPTIGQDRSSGYRRLEHPRMRLLDSSQLISFHVFFEKTHQKIVPWLRFIQHVQ